MLLTLACVREAVTLKNFLVRVVRKAIGVFSNASSSAFELFPVSFPFDILGGWITYFLLCGCVVGRHIHELSVSSSSGSVASVLRGDIGGVTTVGAEHTVIQEVVERGGSYIYIKGMRVIQKIEKLDEFLSSPRRVTVALAAFFFCSRSALRCLRFSSVVRVALRLV